MSPPRPELIERGIMQKTVDAARKVILYISALVLVAGYPTTAMATTEQPAVNSEASAEAQSESQAPEEEKKGPAYTYDPETKKWNSKRWQFNPETGKYERPPAPTIVEPVAPQLPNHQGPQTQKSQDEAVQQDLDSSTKKSSNTEVGINNEILSDALSGNASVAGNTRGGNALSGDASAVANIINAVNSSVGASGNQKVSTFSKDIMGDVKGDIVLYPLLLKAMLEQQAESTEKTKINATTDFDVNNDITLNAQSGDASVKNNTEAGDATSGNAAAMANVVNILNSMIAMQDSFIGTINIYGSLEGDILIAPDFIPQMLASNGGSEGSSSTKVSKQDTTTIVNNISAVAESGAASVFGNTEAGSATTGDADSNVVIFNVTGRDIVAENSMLVFVNVLGKWVGMIVDAPAGATAAMIGTGVTTDQKYAPDLTIESESKHGITNNISVTAGSGDATVANNTKAGDATSGSAHALANVANVSNSSLSLSGWFGICFINIMGDWFGSLGMKTKYGNTPEEPEPNPNGPVEFVPKEKTSGGQSVAASVRRVIVDSRNLSTPAVVAVETTTEAEGETDSAPEAEVMGATDGGSASEQPEEEQNYLFFIVAGAIILIGSSVIGVRRLF